jgi:endonuclease/exonuclease/phosphatase family metal-dependent hydrolase
MRIMTFNIRFENEQDGPNAWAQRRDQVRDLVSHYAPALLGTQEGTWKQLEWLNRELTDYRIHAPERTFDEEAHYTTLHFRKDALDAKEGGEFWLSKTPDTHRSKDWDSAYARMMSYGRFQGRDAEAPFWAAVTHLDHAGEEARREQARMLCNWVRERSGPVILMGDFNDRPGSPVHAILTSSACGLTDTWKFLAHEDGLQSFTHHGFDGIPDRGRLDWILVSSHFRVLEARLIKDNTEGRYPSDHFPYLADLELRCP